MSSAAVIACETRRGNGEESNSMLSLLAIVQGSLRARRTPCVGGRFLEARSQQALMEVLLRRRGFELLAVGRRQLE